MTTCSRCIMNDNNDPDITFDHEGICSYCHGYERRAKTEMFTGDLAGRAGLYNAIKKSSEGNAFDVVMGLSGGLDSSYAFKKVYEMGLNALVVTVDNGWDTEIAKINVNRLLEKVHPPTLRFYINTPEYRALQKAFLDASVANAEIPTDHAIISLLYEVAARRQVTYIVHGGNIVTEAIMPKEWGYDARDWKHILGIAKAFMPAEQVKILKKTFPHMTLARWFQRVFIDDIKWLPILNYSEYIPANAQKELIDWCGWQAYGGKHLESRYTRFFQTWILPTKFKIDKRLAHYSTLINSGLMTRQTAIRMMEYPSYDSATVETDRADVIKALGYTWDTFNEMMQKPWKHYSEYPSNATWIKRFSGFLESARKKATGVI